jgi:hypothetical protein
MWTTTAWAVRTWLKVTVVLALAVFGVWLLVDQRGWFYASLLGAVLIEYWALRALGKEWAYDAQSRWWWSR